MLITQNDLLTKHYLRISKNTKQLIHPQKSLYQTTDLLNVNKSINSYNKSCIPSRFLLFIKIKSIHANIGVFINEKLIPYKEQIQSNTSKKFLYTFTVDKAKPIKLDIQNIGKTSLEVTEDKFENCLIFCTTVN